MSTPLIPLANRLGSVEEYYFSRKLQEIRERNARGEEIINLGIGNPDGMPPAPAIQKMIQTVTEPGAHGYQAYRGTPALRSAFARWYQEIYGVTLDPEGEILPLMGSKEGVFHLCMAFLNEGDQVLTPDPGYPTYAAAARLVGAQTRYYALSAANHWYPDLDELERQDLSRVKMMWVNYPHMPTGALPSRDVFERLIAFGQKHSLLICHDNPYSLVLTPEPMSIFCVPGAKAVAVELNSLSKSHNMAGWRVGMVCGAPAHVSAVLQVKSNLDSGMFFGLQAAAIEALAAPKAWRETQNAIYSRRREEVEALVRDLGCAWQPAQGGMFLWARIPDDQPNGEAFCDAILNQAGVFLTPGFVFGPAGDRYLRASLCSPLELLQQARGRIAARFLTPHPPRP